jgi:hypothetical protein
MVLLSMESPTAPSSKVLHSRPPIEQAKSQATMTGELHSTVLPQITDGTPYTALDVFGPTLEFISGPDEPGAEFCVMRDVVPPGVAVPLHSHDDAEDFFILAGTQQVLTKSDRGLHWLT